MDRGHTELILETRLCPPQLRSGSIARPTLLKKLERAKSKKLSLLIAPAGFGKTTLVLQWLADCDEPIVWLSLENSEDTLELFLLYFISAVQTLEPTIGMDTKVQLKSYAEVPLNALLTPLVNDFHRLAEPCYIVLDDFHRVVEKSCHEALMFLLQHLPSHVRFVITSREMPTFPLARMQAKGELQLLKAEELRFTPEQTELFFRDTMGLELSQQESKLLHQRTEGWATGLQLAGASLEHLEERELFFEQFAGDDQFIGDFLTHEVFIHQPPLIQNFLLKTSVLRRLTPALCLHLLDEESKNEPFVNRLLEKSQFFLVKLDSRQKCYRYLHLFQDWLEHRLDEEFPGLAQELHQKATDWFLEKGDLSEAMYHLMKAGLFEAAASILEEKAPKILEQNSFVLFKNWLSQLPEALLCQRPLLLVYQLCFLFMNRTDQKNKLALRKYLRALMKYLKNSCLDRQEEPRTDKERLLYGIMALGEALWCRSRNEIADAQEFLKEAKALLSAQHKFLSSFVLLMSSANRFRLEGAQPDCLRQLEDAIISCRETDEFYFWMNLSSFYIYTLLLQGRIDDAQNYCEQLDDEFELWSSEYKIPSLFSMITTISKAEVYTKRNQLHKALDCFKEGVTVAEKLGDRRVLYSAKIGLSLTYLMLGDEEAWKKNLVKVQPPPIHGPGHIHWSYAELLRALLVKGGRTEANEWLRQSEFNVNQTCNFVNHLYFLVVVHEQILAGRLDEAEALIERILEKYQELQVKDAYLSALLLKVLFLQEKGAQSKALALLKDVLVAAKPNELVHNFLVCGEPMVVLLTKCLRTSSKKELVAFGDFGQKLLAAFALQKTENPERSVYNSAEEAVQSRPEKKSDYQSVSASSDSSTDLYFLDPLSPREVEIIGLMAEGLTNQEVAKKLHIALSTVKKHSRNIYSKLGVKNRTRAVSRARQLDIIS